MLHSLSSTSITGQPTQHAMLIAWGYFAQTLGLPTQLTKVPIRQKTVDHSPAAKLLTFLLGLLSGIEFLADLSTGAAPLSKDRAVAVAWGLARLASASSVSRTLAAADEASQQVLHSILAEVSQPFLARAIADLRAHQTPLLLDVDLTGRAVSEQSQTYPGAVFGYMDGELRLGYQVAAICLHTRLFGRQWLCGQQHPGNTVSAPCLRDLVTQAEARLGCHPRRRPELLDGRISAARHAYAAAALLADDPDQVRTALRRKEQLRTELNSARCRLLVLQERASINPHAPYGLLNQASRHLRGCQRRWHRWEVQQRQLLQQRRRARQQLPALQTRLWQLETQRQILAAENAQQEDAPRCRLRMDAGFCSGENLNFLLEMGYEIETRVGHGAVLAALQQRVSTETVWTQVGKNAEMIGWTNYQLYSCPYPFCVALERFQTTQGLKYSVLLRSQGVDQPDCPDLREWFAAYNGRQTIESGIKQTKTVFKLQHLMSRQPLGMQMQVALTLFAANFVTWAEAWVAERLAGANAGAARRLQRPKYLVRVAANSPASVEWSAERVRVRFSPLSGLEGVVIDREAPGALQPPPLLPPCSLLISDQ